MIMDEFDFARDEEEIRKIHNYNKVDIRRRMMLSALFSVAAWTKSAYETIEKNNQKIENGEEEPGDNLFNGLEIQDIRDAYESAIRFVSFIKENREVLSVNGVFVDYHGTDLDLISDC